MKQGFPYRINDLERIGKITAVSNLMGSLCDWINYKKTMDIIGRFMKGEVRRMRSKHNPNLFYAWQAGYPDGIPCNKNTAEAFGIPEGTIVKCKPYWVRVEVVDGIPEINMTTSVQGPYNAQDSDSWYEEF